MAKVHKIRENAAGIDIGTEEFFVSTDGETIKVFETFTESIDKIVAYLQDSGIKTVAIEATGVIWVPLYDKLEASGFEVYLVNGAHARNVPGQKSDPFDCRWLQQLHSFGLLSASFIPPDEIRLLRNCVRLRADHVETSSGYILQMQKAFELMNIKLHEVIDQINGVSGLRIVKAILAGERDPENLLQLCDVRIQKNKRERVLMSLNGNYKEEYLFLLKQALECYQFFQGQIQQCDKKIEIYLKEFTKKLPKPEPSKAKPTRHNDIKVKNLHEMLIALTSGKNVSKLTGISDKSFLELISETGYDLKSIWPTQKHFTSWAGLSPRKIESGKMRKNKKKFIPKTRTGQLFRLSAMSIANSKNAALKGFYFRIKSKHGARVAMKATARKLAVLYYKIMTEGMDYVDKGLEEYERNYKEKMIRSLRKKADSLGYTLTPCLSAT